MNQDGTWEEPLSDAISPRVTGFRTLIDWNMNREPPGGDDPPGRIFAGPERSSAGGLLER